MRTDWFSKPFIEKCTEYGAEPVVTNDVITIKAPIELTDDQKYQLARMIPSDMKIEFSIGVATGTFPAVTMLCARAGINNVTIKVDQIKRMITVGLPNEIEIEEAEKTI